MTLTHRTFVLLLLIVLTHPASVWAQQSIAREWNEILLEAIRNDLARPTVHARNLFHTSLAMWDSWAAYDDQARSCLRFERQEAPDVAEARREALSFAVYNILKVRFSDSVGADQILPTLDAKMDELGYDREFRGRSGDAPAAVGNRIAAAVLEYGANDGSNERRGYANRDYLPTNFPIVPASPGNPNLFSPNRWQPIALDVFIDQSGNLISTGSPEFLSAEWGSVRPFALRGADLTVYDRVGFDYWVYHDPGPPPQFGSSSATHDEYLTTFEKVLEWSSLLSPADGVLIDISPGARGNNTLGTNDGSGHATNPATGAPYVPQFVPAGDYFRVLAEFWADGPDSETPPGHWFTIANHVSDHPLLERKIGGEGESVDSLEWDVKLYLALGGAMHDAAVSAWGIKGWYDYVRPLSALRYLADLGQRSDPLELSYHPDGIALEAGRVEVVTLATSAPGQRHQHLAGPGNVNVGKIAARAWRGPAYILDPETDVAGVGWMLVENWWPYQRPSFVTPPFAGYVSGHSTYSRAAAEVLTRFTGDAFFPGGLAEFAAPKDSFLVFEKGPSVDVTLQWATYYDAADECGLSRIYGGIHPPADDVPGRSIGAEIGADAYREARFYFEAGLAGGVDRASVTPASGRISIKGALRSSPSGPSGRLDISQGLTLVVSIGNDTEEVATFDADECSESRSGRIRCRLDDRTARVILKPSKSAAGDYEFKIQMSKRLLALPALPPLRVEVGAGADVWSSVINACPSIGRRLRCKN